MSYQRRYPRDPYDAMLVRGLQAIGYQVRLSSDYEDERLGIDAHDEEFGLKIDFHVGVKNERYSEKIARQVLGGVKLFHISFDLHDDLAATRCGRKALEKLAEVYEKFLEEVHALKAG